MLSDFFLAFDPFAKSLQLDCLTIISFANLALLTFLKHANDKIWKNLDWFRKYREVTNRYA